MKTSKKTSEIDVTGDGWFKKYQPWLCWETRYRKACATPRHTLKETGMGRPHLGISKHPAGRNVTAQESEIKGEEEETKVIGGRRNLWEIILEEFVAGW